jgi:hypothetical protein
MLEAEEYPKLERHEHDNPRTCSKSDKQNK